MTFRIRCLGILATSTFLCGILLAEVPPRSQEDLKKEATLVVTGTITDVKIAETKSRRDGKEDVYQLTVRVGKVETGKVGEAREIIVRGSSIQLKPGFAGSGGHYAGNTYDRIAAVAKGWELTLYLKGPTDGSYEILFPNGFTVVSKPEKK